VIASIRPLDTFDAGRFDTPVVLRRLAAASRQLAELKRLAASIPAHAHWT